MPPPLARIGGVIIFWVVCPWVCLGVRPEKNCSHDAQWRNFFVTKLGNDVVDVKEELLRFWRSWGSGQGRNKVRCVKLLQAYGLTDFDIVTYSLTYIFVAELDELFMSSGRGLVGQIQRSQSPATSNIWANYCDGWWLNIDAWAF